MAPRKKRTSEGEVYSPFASILEDDFLTPTVQTHYGRVEHYRLKLPSWLKWQELWHSVLDIALPFRKNEPNPYDVTYRKDQSEINEWRKALILAWSLSEGGMDIPGDTLEAKAETLQGGNSAILNALWDALEGAVKKGRSWVDPDGVAFRQLRRAGAIDPGAVQLVARLLDQFERNREVEAPEVRDGTAGGAERPADMADLGEGRQAHPAA